MMTAETRSKPRTPKAGLMQSAAELTDFSTGLIRLAELSPRTLTLGQMTFFLIAAMSDLRGRSTTFTEIRDTVGPVIGNSLHTTYKVFLDERGTRSDQTSAPTRLGWLLREEDPTDNRRKFLRLTNKGREVMDELSAALNPNHGKLN